MKKINLYRVQIDRFKDIKQEQERMNKKNVIIIKNMTTTEKNIIKYIVVIVQNAQKEKV
jgi:hypothetical protein